MREPPDAGTAEIHDEAENSAVDLARVAWLSAVGACLIAVVILLLQGYFGYAAVTFAVAARPRSTSGRPATPSRPTAVLVPAARGPRARGGSARRRRRAARAITSWSSCAVSVRLLERGARAELDVQVDVAARARRGGCAARGSRRRRGRANASIAARIASTSSSGSASSTSTREEPISSRTPVTTIAPATSSATTGSSHSAPVICTSASPTSTPTEV